MITQERKPREEVYQIRARECLKGLLGIRVRVGINERRWEELLDRDAELEETHRYLKKAKDVKQ